MPRLPSLFLLPLLFLCTFLTLHVLAESTTHECAVDDDEACFSILSKLELEKFYINGTWVEPINDGSGTTTTKFEVIDPSTGLVVAESPLASGDDVNAAVSSANDALSQWRLTSLEERRQLVERLQEIYTSREEDMAQAISLEMGAPIDMARHSQVGAGEYHMEVALDALQYFDFERRVHGYEEGEEEEDRTTIIMEPIGVVAMITPWNWPMNQVVLKVIPALLVGCTCVLKPSEQAPLSSLLFAEMMHQAGFPPGVFNLVNGDGDGTGTLLSSHPDVDMVSFTGSTRAGAFISKAAADTYKRVSLEMGGKGANIIFADVDDWQEEVEDGVWDSFGNSGQTCTAPTRMLVERSIYREAVEIARKTAASAVVESAHKEGDHLGPVASRAQFQKIQRYIEIGIEEGADLVAGGLGRPEGTKQAGFYVRPTVFANVQSNMTIMQHEILGPVLCIMPFDTEEEAIAIANDSPYGLMNYVQTSSEERRHRLARALRSGMVMMNGIGFDDGAPFGGVGASGGAREGGVYGLEEFCVSKVVSGY